MVFYNDNAGGTMPHCGMAPAYPKSQTDTERMICVVVKFREQKSVMHAAVALFERLLSAPTKMKIKKSKGNRF